MEDRGQSRPEMVDEQPADKRACHSLEDRPTTSNSSAQTQIHGTSSTQNAHEVDVGTSSDEEYEEDFEYEDDLEYESDDYVDAETTRRILTEYQRRISSDHNGKLKRLLLTLSEEADPSVQLAALSELCDVLSFCSEDSLSSSMADLLSQVLVKLAKDESHVDIMFLAFRAITYFCDVFQLSSSLLVKHNAVSALCERLKAVEYLDVAEQCLRALEKISRYQPFACLNAGALKAILGFIDFCSTSVQGVAVATVRNICKELPPETFSPFIDAVLILLNLLHYKDQQLVESVVIGLTEIAEQAFHSTVMVDELCRHGLIHQLTHLLRSNTHTALPQPVYDGLIEMLAKFSSRTFSAFRTLYKLKVSCILKKILSTDEITHNPIDRSNQVLKYLKLINALLPSSLGEFDVQLAKVKESHLHNHPDLLERFGVDLLPALVQMVNSSANTYVCYGCLSAIYKLIYLNKSEAIVDLLKVSNISRVLAGVISRKDNHVLVVSLRIVEMILNRHSGTFMNIFIKEGVFFAIDTLLNIGKHQQLTSLASDGGQTSTELSCLCQTFESSLPSAPTCRVENDSVNALAKHIQDSFVRPEVFNSDKGLMDILQNLQNLSLALSELADIPLNNSTWRLHGDKLSFRLLQVMETLNEAESISTFEFIESGIFTSLVRYLSNGLYLRGSLENPCSASLLSVVGKRFEAFTSLLSSSTELTSAVLTKKLQNALSSLENFPVIISQFFGQRNSVSTVPYVRRIAYPCLKVCFLKEEGETFPGSYTQASVNVDPFCSLSTIELYLWRILNADKTNGTSAHALASSVREDVLPRLLFYLEGNELNQSLSLYQVILQLKLRSVDEIVIGIEFWNQTYKITYKKKAVRLVDPQECSDSVRSDEVGTLREYAPFLSDMFACDPASDLDKSSPIYDILFLLKSLECMNRFLFHLTSLDRMHAFAEGRVDNLDSLRVVTCPMPQSEFISCKLTEKLEQQMLDIAAVSAGGLPSWCNQLMASFHFLFSFEAKSKYLRLAAFGYQQPHHHPQSQNRSTGFGEERFTTRNLPRNKFIASREQLLVSALQMLELHAQEEVPVEVTFSEEAGTGLGPTLEFYTLVSREFQNPGYFMWRYVTGKANDDSETLMSSTGLFPRPWSTTSKTSLIISEVVQKFVLLGKVVAKALRDRRVLDLPFSKAFYKLILGQELSLFDIHSFDPALYKTLMELQALVHRKKFLERTGGGDSSTPELDLCFRGTRVEDLCLAFSLPGYPDYVLASGSDKNMVDMSNLEEYIKLVVDATVRTGIHKQVEAFRSGFNQIFPIGHLAIFNEDELDLLLCGERSFWNFDEVVDLIKCDHGYTSSSQPILNLLEILQDFEREQQRAFIQFVTGAPQLPSGGLASLNPKLTIVRKHCTNAVDAELPSVMTCAHYLKLPPYSSKEIMKEKLVLAITEGQGSFQLS